MSNELAPRHSNSLLPGRDDWQTMMQMADAFCKSGLLPTTIKTPQAALLIIQKGAELGLKPTYALSNIAVVQGKPVVGAEVMLNLVYRDHGDNAIRFTETTAKVCTIEYRRRAWKDPQHYSFSIEDAQGAGLTNKDNWKHYPAAMLRARCISAVARMAFPDSIAGMYTPEELGVDEHMDDQGNTTLTVTEDAPHPKDHSGFYDMRKKAEPEPMEQPEDDGVIEGEVVDDHLIPVDERQAMLSMLEDMVTSIHDTTNKSVMDVKNTIGHRAGVKGDIYLADGPDLHSVMEQAQIAYDKTQKAEATP